MRPSEIKHLIVILLSSTRKLDNPSHCLGMTCLQICTHVEGLLPPSQEVASTAGLRERITEQLDVLESEFEISSIGERRKAYRMAPPVLIIERESPLRLKYVGDRAYFNTVVNLLNAEHDLDTRMIETTKTLEESREILEARGIAVQTEDMLFQFLPEPALPTDVELSMAEKLIDGEIPRNLEVYIPRRKDFFASRWEDVNMALPNEMSQLRRARAKSFLNREYRLVYFWEATDQLYKISKDQAMLASYRIDLDRGAPRLLDLNKPIPGNIRNELPSSYHALLDRYTQTASGIPPGVRGNEKQRRYLQVRFKHKELFAKLLETKLGINKPLI